MRAILIIGCIILAVVFLEIVRKASRRVTVMCVVLLCVIGIGSATMYLLNFNFRQAMDMYFMQSDEHWFRMEDENEYIEYVLPLPPNTALRYRDSYTQAGYVSRLSKEDIFFFYENIFVDDCRILDEQSQEIEFAIQYEDFEVSIRVKESENKSMMDIHLLSY